MDRVGLAARLKELCSAGDESALAALAGRLGYREAGKAAANLMLLWEWRQEPSLLAAVAEDALDAADPGLALNNLERLTATAPAEDLATVLETESGRGRLLTVLGASPFLCGILCRDPSYFDALFTRGGLDRQKGEDEILAELRGLIDEKVDFETLQAGLRRFKGQEILRIGSRDLCGLAGLQEVTAELSSLAAATLQRAYEVCDRLLRVEYGAPLVEAEDGEEAEVAEFTILGMGKFGGRELNFSSDIDLIYFYSSEHGQTAGVEDGRGGRRNRISLHAYFVKLAEMVTKAINQVTADGFVFRVDLRLRPEGSRGEMAMPRRSAEIYYESWGRSWERAAMLKARPVAGSLALGEKILASLEPFIYRRYLDYGMVEDIKGMKQKIDRSLARERGGESNLKLGRGGIREIEFFIQALQLIYGGKDPTLRQRSSLKSLDALCEADLLGAEECRTLHHAYIFLRTVEHRIQVEQERQTHSLPAREEELEILARRCGYPSLEPFRADLERHRQAVEAIYRDLFYAPEEELREEVRPEIAYIFDEEAETDMVLDLLEERGFKNPEGAYESLRILRDGPPHSPLTAQGRRQLERIAPLLLQEVCDSPEPDMALNNLERFLTALRARTTFYALLAENREIIKLLISLFGTSQFLSRIFIQHPEILDSLVSRTHAVISKTKAELAEDLEELFATAKDFEDRLDLLRRFRNEEFLRIALNDLSGQLGQAEGTRQLSYLAEVCLEKALAMAREELMPRFGVSSIEDKTTGELREAGFAVIGMGKLGGRELNYHSDLDIIFIYEGEGKNRPGPGTDPARFKELTNHEYFSRLAQRIISVLTLLTREGYVYQIDTRLRPSGNQGPLVSSLPAFERYHQSSAQLWERQAMAKARAVAGQEFFTARLEEMLGHLTFDRPLEEGLKEEIYRLRGRMESEIAKESREHFNIKTGRGGMVDVEFLAQYLQLLHGGGRPALRVPNTIDLLHALEKEGLLQKEECRVLVEGYKFLRRLENKLRILHDHSMNELSAERSYLTKLARFLGYPSGPKRPDVQLLEQYGRMTDAIRTVFDRYLKPNAEA